MRPTVSVWTVIGGICAVISAIAATYEILDRWQRPASGPPSSPESRPAIPVEAPEADGLEPKGADVGASPSPLPQDTAPTEERVPSGQAPAPIASKLEALINRRAVPAGSAPLMAIALDGDARDVELMEAALAQVPSAGMRLVLGFFKPAFRERGFLRAVYDGDMEALTGSGALAAVDRVLVGRVERTCRATGQLDDDLVTCDVRLSFKVVDRHGAVVNAGQVAVPGAGFSEDAARDRAVEMLVEQHGERIVSGE